MINQQQDVDPNSENLGPYWCRKPQRQEPDAEAGDVPAAAGVLRVLVRHGCHLKRCRWNFTARSMLRGHTPSRTSSLHVYGMQAVQAVASKRCRYLQPLAIPGVGVDVAKGTGCLVDVHACEGCTCQISAEVHGSNVETVSAACTWVSFMRTE